MTDAASKRLGAIAAAVALVLASCAAPSPTAPISATMEDGRVATATPRFIPASPAPLPAHAPQQLVGRNRSQPAALGPARAGDDFYRFVNHEWLDTFDLPPHKASVGAAEDLMQRSDEDVRRMIEEFVAAKPAKGTIEQKIADLYSSAMDEAGIERRGVEPLQPFFQRIRAVRTWDDLMRLMGVIGYNSPIGAGVAPSPADPDRNAVWVSQAGLGMPHRGYYLGFGAEVREQQRGYRDYVTTILTLIGNADPQGGAQRIYNLERRIAQAHTDEDRSISAEESLKAMNYAELKAYAPDFGWDLFLGEAGFAGAQMFVVTDQTAVRDLATLVREIPLDDWKLWMEFHIANEFAPYLPKAFADAQFDYYSRQLSGVSEEPERWQFAVGLVNERLGDAVAQLYVKRHFSAADKQKIDAIVANVRAAFESRIRSLDWMDDTTRAAALEKLAALKGMIGAPDTWRDFSGFNVEPGKLVETLYAGFEFEWAEQQADLDKPVDRTRWPTAAHVVNAFYNPLGNTFVLPAGILKPPFFDPAADAAVNYGAIGAVIGHEMSHGFDDQGRQFDGAGRTFNWWTEETDERFLAKANRLIDQYDAYCPFTDACVNGLGTLGENIGDLSGLEIAYAAWKLSLGGKEAPVIDGLTGDQRFFISYARSYRDKVQEELARALLEGDSHAPSRYRVNGVVRNMDAWYRAFDVKPADKLYLAPEERVRLW